MARSIHCAVDAQVARTCEHILIKPNGDAARCRTVFRVLAQDRWDAKAVLAIRGIPRRTAPSSAESMIRASIAGEEGEAVDPDERRRDMI